MKLRKGFVSNSSSSSFVCDVCGAEASGMDLCLSDAEMDQCNNGHTFCKEHVEEELEAMPVEDMKKFLIKISDDKDQKKEIKEADEDELRDIFEEMMGELEGEFPTEICPLCTFKELSDSDFITYVISTTGKSREDFCNEIKSKVKSYKEFEKKFSSENKEQNICDITAEEEC